MKRIHLYLLILPVLSACILTACGLTAPPTAEKQSTQDTVASTKAESSEAPSEALTDSVTEAAPSVSLPFTPHTDELPILSISTEGAPVDSRSYVPMTLTLAGTEDPLVDIHGSIRLRGNSTYTYVKKPYRIKLDQKHSLFGLDKAKSWVLLADYLDPSTLHNYAALTLAGTSEYLEFVPTPHKVNLYLNGEFMGLYTLCEQVQEQEGRLDLEFSVTEDMTELSDYNFLLCMNYNAPEKEGAVEGETYFYLSGCGRYFELEYPTKEDFPSEAQFYRFFAALEDYMRETVDAFMHTRRQYLSKNVDMDSLTDLYIVDRIMGERDHHWKSLFMYYRGAEGDARLRFGPPWDYDFCMYTQWTSAPNEAGRNSLPLLETCLTLPSKPIHISNAV